MVAHVPEDRGGVAGTLRVVRSLGEQIAATAGVVLVRQSGLAGWTGHNVLGESLDGRSSLIARTRDALKSADFEKG